uniref:Methyltransferase domain-containing protein n=1 Tax=Haptolina brevifila TaxID=156173 RepID=A0A7S2GSM3_9EUKA|mmetsp:Transcript_45333/g.90505  ORF Transcript_45333/g.90505 Transcript_45333/m.90505 type:complete len:267 (+) Transcript_45333:114-914(+)|eukprot:CAMPEP_0174748262 /NCGR_PEP_ID=MMETSP1094-20130205/93014_1 /TAXON_ID=156173 /ORGANISM="Chrysochromulina brevifilum, Strain UTEX LB 985" /LENGTH=266 /DNA_ID=CAMNT_0015953259 /DNA_START=35 /DNA_END=835 /DNA_ORIENTATION=-
MNIIASFALCSLATLEDLANRYDTDKALQHGHGYTSAYSMLLDPHHLQFQNVTEVGVLTGSSLLMWADYFPNATIWGLDIVMRKEAYARTASEPRIKLLPVDGRSSPSQLQLLNESMDLVIEDASHGHTDSMQIAATYWPLVKPGGFYIIEDINTGGDARGKYSYPRDRSGYASIVHNATGILKKIFHHNEVFFADTLVGVDSAHSRFVRDQTKKSWMLDQVDHNSHLMVVRKRVPAVAVVSSGESHGRSEESGREARQGTGSIPH